MESEFRRELAALLPRLMRFAVALTRSRDEGEDLAQAACERALARAGQWQPDTRLDSWMFRITQTIWLNRLRARAVGERYRAELARGEAAASAPQAEERLMLTKVAEKVLELPDEQRIVLMLVTVEGLTYREAAEIAGIPIGTVMSRLHRGRKALQKALTEYGLERGLVQAQPR
ncbi:MAG TPA: sigma-70 family RNA polymerase sigma factor [Acetobacteraceae bacterium]|nr:sigma-70 family RNA polymerase sigma factor [Acetobacteraceae bacterium]